MAIDQIECRLCGLFFGQISGNHLSSKHGITSYRYEKMFPNVPMRSPAMIQAEEDRWTPEARAQQSRMITKRNIEDWGDPEKRKEREKAIARAWREIPPEKRVRGTVTHTEETIEKMRQTALKRWARATPEERLKQTEEARRDYYSKDNIEARRQGLLRNWASVSPEDRRKRMEAIIAAQGKRSPTRPEALLWEFLEEHYPGMFIPDWVNRASIGGRFPDFRTKNGYKLVIESFGSHWHDSVDFPKRPLEEELIILYRKEGYDCIVVWADNPGDIIVEWPSLVKKIQNYLEVECYGGPAAVK